MTDQNWIRPDGEPITGKVPPTVVLRAGVMTPLRHGWVRAFYAQFCSAKRLSIVGSAYFTGTATFPDGTKARALSVRDVDHIHVWASDTVTADSTDMTFWCIPWDDAWIDEPFTDVFTIPRWLEVGPGEGEVPAEDFLETLNRNQNYEPPAEANYPGNQTWFAPPPHALAGVVVSWWGPSKRYANSERDLVVAAAGVWGRTVWPQSDVVSFTDTPEEDLAPMMVAPTGGVGGAVGGHMFDMLDATELPPDVINVGIPQLASQSVWINGVRMSAGRQVNSACLRRQGEATFLRIATIEVGPGGKSVRVLEKRISDAPGPPPEWVSVGVASLAPASVGLQPPLTGWANTVTLGLTWQSDYAHLAQPFLWNADGSKAVAVVHYVTNATSAPGDNSPLPREKFGTHAVVEITVGSGSLAAAIVDQTTETVSRTSAVTTAPPPTSPPNNTFAMPPTRTTVVEATSEYSAPIAADYRSTNSAPAILKAHTRLHGTSDRLETNSNAVYSWSGGGGGSAYFSPSGTVSGTYTAEYESWVTFDDEEIDGTRLTRTANHSEVGNRETDVVEDYPGGAYNYGQRHDYVTNTLSASGSFGLWGLAAGDLRDGVVLLHNTPMSRLSGAPAACQDTQSNYSILNSYHRIIAGTVTASIDVTVTDEPDAGLLCVANLKDMSSDERGKLFSPNLRYNLGTLSASQGGSVSVTRSGPYGDGPWIGLDLALDSGSGLPQLNIALGVLAMCPIPWTMLSDSLTGTSRLTANASRTAINLGGAYFSGSADVVGGYGNAAISSSAITPDTKTQYVGAVMVAMTEPTTKDDPISFVVDEWFHDGAEFVPSYPEQPPPGGTGAPVPFPHRGGHAILRDPIFTGPLP